MAGDWIKMRGNLWDDPRVSKLCDLCDCAEAQIVGGLYWLWATADQHTEDGVMPCLTLRQIDRKTGIQGFGEALCAIGWLADHPEGVRIVNFEEHNGASAKKRAVTAKRVANHRAGNAEETQQYDRGNAQVTKPALQNEHTSVSRALAREREEKSREDVNHSEANASAGEPAKVTDPDEIIFGYGVPLLTSSGTPEKHARSFLGGLRKQHGDAALIDKLRECIKAKPLQPIEWLGAALPPRSRGAHGGRTPSAENFASRDYGAGGLI